MADIPLEEVITQCLAAGMSPLTIAQRFNIKLDDVLQFGEIQITRRSDAEELGQAMVNLSWRAYEEAMNILYQGNTVAKMRLITQIVGRNISLVNSQSPKALEEMKLEFANLLHDMSTDSTEDSIYGNEVIDEEIESDSPIGKTNNN